MSSIGGFQPHSTSSPRDRTARTELFRSGKDYTFATVQCVCVYEFSSKIPSCIYIYIVLHISKQRFIWKCTMFMYSLCFLPVDLLIRQSTTYFPVSGIKRKKTWEMSKHGVHVYTNLS